MSTRNNYGQLADKLNYSELEQKITQLAEREPPKIRKTAADMLEPLREKLLALHRKGWSSAHLVQELKAAGVPISVARFRECLTRWNEKGNRNGKPRNGSRPKVQPENDKPNATLPPNEWNGSPSKRGPRIAKPQDV
jgi:hypothetical protein